MTGKFGDWENVERQLSEIGRNFTREMERTTDKLGHLFVGIIVRHFEAQDLPWKTLNEKYQRAKVMAGYSEQILIRTATLMNNINYQKLDAFTGYVGVIRKEPRKGYDLAWIHEFGTRDGRVPARPYMRPSAREFEPIMVAEYQAAVDRVFK